VKEGITMIKTSDILDEKDKHLRAKNKEVTFPLSKERKKLIDDMLEHLYYSQIEKYAEKYGITVVLKGAGTLIANSRMTASNHTGNAGMAVGGCGDILAGIIGSIIAQGCSVYDSACAGVYIHGLAGDAAAQKLGMESMLPRDIVDCLSDSFRLLKEKHGKKA
jgi:hydroxyethylthiazole kinase-like uncharacterized protein yjeF